MAVGCTVGAGVGFWVWGGGYLRAAALYTVPAACSASYRCGLRAAMYFKKTEDRDAWRGSRVYSQRFSTFSARRAVHPVRSSHFLLTFPGRKYDCISKPDPSIDRRRWAAIGRRLGSDVLVDCQSSPGMLLRVSGWVLKVHDSAPVSPSHTRPLFPSLL